MNLFHSAALRLTLAYLSIIMGLSIGFSIVVYRLSANELDRGLRRPPAIIQLPGGSFDFEGFRQVQLRESNLRLRQNMVFFNLSVLVAGGVLSYFLARRTLKPIEEALEAQSRFTADASHELRTPLTAMRTEIDVALRNPKLNAKEGRQLLKSNLEEISKLQGLSESLLRLAKQDGQNPTRSSFDLRRAVHSAWKNIEPQARLKHISLKKQVPRLVLTADKSGIVELLTILLENAVKYSEPNKLVTVAATQDAQNTHLWVNDNGYGIKKNQLSHVFERFYRTDQSRSKAGGDGYGLGLAIARQIVTAHQGTIEVDSDGETGSTFTITLPRSTA